MGNRAVICTKEAFENNGVGVYLHWNGGRDSVEAFLEYCKIRGFRGFDTHYGIARFVQVVSNFLGADGLSVGIDVISHLDCNNGDNGVYFVEDWDIVGRKYAPSKEQSDYDRKEMLKSIDECQSEPIGEEYFDGIDVDVDDLKIGDTVYVRQWNGEFKKLKVLDFGKDMWVNGTNVKGKPFVDTWENGMRDNINNYITRGKVRKIITSEG